MRTGLKNKPKIVGIATSSGFTWIYENTKIGGKAMSTDIKKLTTIVYVGFGIHFLLGVAVGFWTVILIKYCS